jgi:hypothetical protein
VICLDSPLHVSSLVGFRVVKMGSRDFRILEEELWCEVSAGFLIRVACDAWLNRNCKVGTLKHVRMVGIGVVLFTCLCLFVFGVGRE